MDAMKRPVVGVIGSEHLAEGRFPAQRVGERNLKAVADVAGALPLIFAGDPAVTDIEALLATVDGVLLTGARANVHPTQFGAEEHPSYEPYDRRRDALALQADQGLRRARRAAARPLPGFPGDERGLRRLAASGDQGTARPHEPPHAAAADRVKFIRTRR